MARLFRSLCTQRRRVAVLIACAGSASTIGMLGMTACSASDLVKVQTSTDSSVVNQGTVNSYSGAIGMYYAAIGQMNAAFSLYSSMSGTFADELTSSNYYPELDSRTNADSSQLSVQTYGSLQRARILAQYAAGALQYYGNKASYPLIGELYALRGFSEVLLAESYCSGVPLSDAPFKSDFRYSRGFSTTEILQHAIAHFDSAYTYGKDSLPIATAAQVGKGRALLNLGQFAAAAAAVANVPANAAYQLQYASGFSFWTQISSGAPQPFTFVSKKGANGAAWLSTPPIAQDPRLPVSVPPSQAKYSTSVSQVVSVDLADGIEAQLIIAEAQLHGDVPGAWLATLNAARATLTSGGIRSLADTTDPGSADRRVDLLFHERAFWMYLTGHRQGDLRRLIRQYGRSVGTTYPIGVYQSQNTSFPSVSAFFGTAVTIGVPGSERENNVLYTGCIDRHA